MEVGSSEKYYQSVYRREGWGSPTGSLWSNQVLNLPSGSTTVISSFLKYNCPLTHDGAEKPQLHLWQTFAFLKRDSPLYHHALCVGGNQHLPGQPLQIVVCFLYTEEKRNLDLTICLSHTLICLCRHSKYLRAIKHSSQMTKPAGTWYIILAVPSACKICTLMKYCSTELLRVLYSSTNACSIFFGDKSP